MSVETGPNAAQADYWSTDAGPKWIENQTALDAVFAPVALRVVELAELKPGARVLDIGCGAGATSFLAAEHVGRDGMIMGLDISKPLLARAEERRVDETVPQIAFTHGDAQTHAFDEKAFDAAISRFGVMFFSDPAAAFANIARGLRPGAVIVFAAWGPVDANPWFSIPQEAALARHPAPPPSDPHGPGPLAFADAARVIGLMQGAGLREVRARTEVTTLTPRGGVVDVARLASRLGPAARILRAAGADDAAAQVVADEIAIRLSAYADGDGSIRIPATLHYYQATA